MKVLMILGVLLISLLVIIPLVEKFAKPSTEKDQAKLGKIMMYLMGVLMLALTIRYFMGG